MNRLYSLFRQVDGQWQHVVDCGSYPLEDARRLFQSRMVSAALLGKPLELRAVRDQSTTPIPRLCKECKAHLHTKCLKGDCKCNCLPFTRKGEE